MYDETIGLATGKVGEFELSLFRQMKDRIKILQSPRSMSPARVWEYNIETGRFVNLPTEGVQALLNLVKSIDIPTDHIFEKIWVVESDHSSVDPNVLPFIPHFDRKRTTKIMLYLTDVSHCDGPMYIATNRRPHDYEVSRRQVVAKGENLVTDADVVYEPLLGPAGHFHIFDTNLPHFAGAPTQDGSRSVIRFDFVHVRQ